MKKLISLILAAAMLFTTATAFAGRRPAATVDAPDGVYGGYTDVAAVIDGDLPRGATAPYVLGFCYKDGEGVWGAYYEVINGQTTIGPFASSIWPGGSATCTAELGYFTRNGFGRWVLLAEDDFVVNDSSEFILSAAAINKNSVSVSNLRGDPTFQGDVTVDITWKLSGNNWPMAVASCYQNGELVYATLDGPGKVAPSSGTDTVTFRLGGGGSDWINNGGGPASCDIQAFSYGYSRGYQQIIPYNTIYFEAV